MRPWLLLLFCCSLASCASLPATATPVQPREVAGVLPGETRLSGTVVVSGDLLVPEGGTLVIAAGTELLIRGADNTKIDPEYLSAQTEILVRGTLSVEGTPERPVRFLPERPAAAGEIAWAGILLDHAAPSRIVHAVVEQADQGVLCVATAPEIRDSLFSGCRYGIVAQAGSHPLLLDNRIEQGEGGVFVWGGSKPYLKGNRITANHEEGVLVDASSRPWLDRNEISGNAIGLALWPSDLPYDPVGVKGNREEVRLLGAAP